MTQLGFFPQFCDTKKLAIVSTILAKIYTEKIKTSTNFQLFLSKKQKKLSKKKRLASRDQQVHNFVTINLDSNKKMMCYMAIRLRLLYDLGFES
jgi:hypothetical protein